MNLAEAEGLAKTKDAELTAYSFEGGSLVIIEMICGSRFELRQAFFEEHEGFLIIFTEHFGFFVFDLDEVEHHMQFVHKMTD